MWAACGDEEFANQCGDIAGRQGGEACITPLQHRKLHGFPAQPPTHLLRKTPLAIVLVRGSPFTDMPNCSILLWRCKMKGWNWLSTVVLISLFKRRRGRHSYVSLPPVAMTIGALLDPRPVTLTACPPLRATARPLDYDSCIFLMCLKCRLGSQIRSQLVAINQKASMPTGKVKMWGFGKPQRWAWSITGHAAIYTRWSGGGL